MGNVYYCILMGLFDVYIIIIAGEITGHVLVKTDSKMNSNQIKYGTILILYTKLTVSVPPRTLYIIVLVMLIIIQEAEAREIVTV